MKINTNISIENEYKYFNWKWIQIFQLKMNTNISISNFKDLSPHLLCVRNLYYVINLITIQIQSESSLNNVSKLAPTVHGSTTAVESGCTQRSILFSYCTTINLEQSISARWILPLWPHQCCPRKTRTM